MRSSNVLVEFICYFFFFTRYYNLIHFFFQYARITDLPHLQEVKPQSNAPLHALGLDPFSNQFNPIIICFLLLALGFFFVLSNLLFLHHFSRIRFDKNIILLRSAHSSFFFLFNFKKTNKLIHEFFELLCFDTLSLTSEIIKNSQGCFFCDKKLTNYPRIK